MVYKNGILNLSDVEYFQFKCFMVFLERLYKIESDKNIKSKLRREIKN